VAVLDPTVSVSVELPPAVTEVGFRLPLAPEGRPETARLTFWAAPDVTAVLMVLVPEPPWATVTVEGFALIEKSFTTGGVTVRLTLVAWVADEPVPVIVRVYPPAGVLELVVTVRVELPPAGTDVGLKLALAPDGRPETERLTLWALPDVTAVLTVVLAEPPWVVEMLLGLALSEKSFTAITVRVTLVVWVAEEPVPVTVKE
jgi:hypothetical protein